MSALPAWSPTNPPARLGATPALTLARAPQDGFGTLHRVPLYRLGVNVGPAYLVDVPPRPGEIYRRHVSVGRQACEAYFGLRFATRYGAALLGEVALPADGEGWREGLIIQAYANDEASQRNPTLWWQAPLPAPTTLHAVRTLLTFWWSHWRTPYHVVANADWTQDDLTSRAVSWCSEPVQS